MIAILSGDIIGSRTKRNAKQWLKPLKKVLNSIGSNPKTWEIFQGDSFQVEVLPEKAFYFSLLLKATIRSISDLDVRIAIGLGNKTFQSNKIAESNGSAFIYSGETLKSLKNLKNLKNLKQNLRLKSDVEDFDQTFNLFFKFALITMDTWTTRASEIVVESLQHPTFNQKELGAKLGITQSSVSQRQKTAHLNELLTLNTFYQAKLIKLPAE